MHVSSNLKGEILAPESIEGVHVLHMLRVWGLFGLRDVSGSGLHLLIGRWLMSVQVSPALSFHNPATKALSFESSRAHSPPILQGVVAC